MKLISAWTAELDDTQAAVDDICGQLDLERNLCAQACGFITCSYDFVETGIVEALCRALPFDVVGCTTLTNATNGHGGTMDLCLTVLTADDCRFVAAATEALGDALEEKIARATQAACLELGDAPKLMLAFLPMMGVGGEIMLQQIDSALGGTPIFGTLACDFDTAEYENSFVFHNGRPLKDAVAFMLISGNVQPRFVVTSTSEQNIRKQQAVITASQGSLVKQINNMTAREYFHSIGLMAGNGIEGMSSVPFVVDYNDGTQPVARAIYKLNDDGSAVCGGVMPEGGLLSIGRMDVDDILLTARQSLEKLMQGDISGLILFPCLGRNMVLGTDPLAEIEVVESLAGDLPWHLAYSGGEICPVYTQAGGTANRFHNFTFIGCAI